MDINCIINTKDRQSDSYFTDDSAITFQGSVVFCIPSSGRGEIHLDLTYCQNIVRSNISARRDNFVTAKVDDERGVKLGGSLSSFFYVAETLLQSEIYDIQRLAETNNSLIIN